MSHGGNSHQRRIRRRLVSRQSQHNITDDPARVSTSAAYLSIWSATWGRVARQKSKYNWRNGYQENSILKLVEELRHGGSVRIVSASDFAACGDIPDVTIKVEAGRIVVRDRDGVELEPRVKEELSRVMISEEGELNESGQKRLLELFLAKSDLMIFAGCGDPSLNFRTGTEVEIAAKSRPWCSDGGDTSRFDIADLRALQDEATRKAAIDLAISAEELDHGEGHYRTATEMAMYEAATTSSRKPIK